MAVLALALVAAACTESSSIASPDDALEPQFALGNDAGFVYTMTNGRDLNRVFAYRRTADGALTFITSYPTGGQGTGGGLGNQGGVVLHRSGRFLFVVNAGSNSVSVFARANDGSLTLADVEPSGGTMPISIASHERMLYVLNAGGAGSVDGFHLVPQTGDLTALAGSSRPLSQTGAGPAQVDFTPNGAWLVVTEKMTNRIVTYRANHGTGLVGNPVVNDSDGMTPFGFSFDNSGLLIVSNAAGGAPGAGSVSSYTINSNGSLTVHASQVPDFQAAPCWIVVNRNGRYAYTTNTASNNTSGYAIGAQGQLTLLDASGVTATNTGGPIDAAVTRRGLEFLYVLNSAGAIDGFRLNGDGSLTPITGGITGLRPGTNGLAAI
jgi:6-phosphogluconolactonase (cycloisomerase 2 family)